MSPVSNGRYNCENQNRYKLLIRYRYAQNPFSGYDFLDSLEITWVIWNNAYIAGITLMHLVQLPHSREKYLCLQTLREQRRTLKHGHWVLGQEVLVVSIHLAA